MIPRNVTREHVLIAIAFIDRNGVPIERESRSWSLMEEGKPYPPKYVISVSNRFANFIELPPEDFRIGEARRHLVRLGFKIARKD